MIVDGLGYYAVEEVKRHPQHYIDTLIANIKKKETISSHK